MQPSRFVMVESAAAACESPRAAAACACDKLMEPPPVAAGAETGSSAAITTQKTKRMMHLRFTRSPPGRRIPVRRITYFGLILNWTKVQPAALMSALPPKADMCSALVHVRFVPRADIARHSSSEIGSGVVRRTMRKRCAVKYPDQTLRYRP